MTATTQQFRPTMQSTKLRLVPARRLAPATHASHRWGVVLAGGDGTRLRELTQRVWGDRPKQFCPILGGHTLLEVTMHRAERSIPPEQILFSLMQAHRQYYLPSLGSGPSPRIVQPFNKGTAPAILYALMRIAQTDADAIVSIFPCDHYYSPESAFTAALESALEIADQRTDSVVLFGAQPNEAEIEYGWIEIGEAVGGHAGLFRIEGFQEKPPLALAEALLRRGSLWNTFVMVGHVRAFLEMARKTVPSLLQVLESAEVTSHPDAEIRIPDSIYAQIAPMDFSRHILALATNSLLAFRLTNIEWSDLGHPYRLLATLVERDGGLPVWAKLWFEPKAIRRSAAAPA
jgi:mannose-1-phosphate guanylyltransferase